MDQKHLMQKSNETILKQYVFMLKQKAALQTDLMVYLRASM